MNGSWKTTLVGALLAIAVAVQPLIQTGQIDWKAVGIAALIALLGYLAKDSDVTGGTKDNGKRALNAMKKAGMILILLTLSSTAFSQGNKWAGFFKPVDQTIIVKSRDLGQPASVWLFRPTIELTALQMVYNKDLKQFESSSLQSGGFGIGYQHFVEANGMPYNNFGVNVLLLFGVSTSPDPASLSLAGTISALKFVNVGAGYDFSGKKVFLLTGITYNFN